MLPTLPRPTSGTSYDGSGCTRRAALSALAMTIFAPGTVMAREVATDRSLYRNGHGAVEAGPKNGVLLFGGADERRVLGDLRTFDRCSWRLLSASGPTPRTFPAMAFDARRQRLVLFGGNRDLFGSGGNALLDDHWEWDGQSWHQMGGTRPPCRAEAACAYDPQRQSVLLFGGYRFVDGNRVRLGDLWEWKGAGWTLLSECGPPLRSAAALCHDPVGKQMLLLGGNGARKDCWSYSDGRWKEVADLPQGRTNPSACADPATGRIMVFGGWNGRERMSDTMSLGSSAWVAYIGSQPPARNHSILVPIPELRGSLLVGGHNGEDIFGDAWLWNGRWRPLILAPPRRRIANGH